MEHALATQTLLARKMKNMLVQVDGVLPAGITAKDLVLAIIGRIGTAGGTGYAIEYAGSAIRALSMEGRMTLCNMTIEAGARTGMVAVDEQTLNYIKGRPFAPKGEMWDQAVAYWKTLVSDPGAKCLVKAQAEREGLHKIFLEAGFEWREPGCSMCLGMNPDRLEVGERSASTSNRNFEGRQGTGGRTHLVSPAMAAAAGIAGHFVDIRHWK